MERPKVNWPHQNIYDEINDRLWNDQMLVHEYQKMWQDTMINHYSRAQRDELWEQLKEKLDKFHLDFIYSYEKIIKDIVSNYIFEYKSKTVLERINQDLEYKLRSFINDWKQYLSPMKTLDTLFDVLPQEEWVMLKCSDIIPSFVDDNYNDELIINSSYTWKLLFLELGLTWKDIYNKVEERYDRILS